MKRKTIFDYPLLIAVVIILVCGRTLGIGTGAVLAAWYCACMSNQVRLPYG